MAVSLRDAHARRSIQPGSDQPVHYGQSFNRPSKRVLRKARQQNGKRMFERGELIRILDALDGKPVVVETEDEPVTLPANPALKAMVLLAINCGFGQSDCANLPKSAVDLDSAWIPRAGCTSHNRP